MITFNYETPQNGDTHITGTWVDGENSGDFQSVVVYTNGEVDIAATEARLREAWGE